MGCIQAGNLHLKGTLANDMQRVGSEGELLQAQLMHLGQPHAVEELLQNLREVLGQPYERLHHLRLPCLRVAKPTHWDVAGFSFG